MIAPLTEARVRELIHEELTADEAAEAARRAEVHRQSWQKTLAGLRTDTALFLAGLPLDETFTTDAGITYPKADYPTLHRRYLSLADGRAARGDIAGANEIRAALALPLLDQSGEHLVGVDQAPLNLTQGVDDPREDGPHVVGVGLSALGVEDVGDVGDQLIGDGCGVAGLSATEVEGFSQGHDSSPSFGVDSHSVGVDGPASGDDSGAGHGGSGA